MLRSLAAILFCSGCAADFHRVHRGDWVKAAGLVLPRAVYEAEVRAGRRGREPVSFAAAPELLEVASPLLLERGEVRTYTIRDDAVGGLAVTGDAVRVYWTESRERRSVVHLEGAAPGTSRLRLMGRPAPPRVLEIRVR